MRSASFFACRWAIFEIEAAKIAGIELDRKRLPAHLANVSVP